MHMALVGVRDGFISAQVSESSPSLKGEKGEFSRTLQVFKYFTILFMAHFMTHIQRYVYLCIGFIMGNVIKNARIVLFFWGGGRVGLSVCKYLGVFTGNFKEYIY